MRENAKNRKDAEVSQRVLLPRAQLVDREDQIKKFRDVLGRIGRQAPVPSNLFEWYGSPGIGKTTLVNTLTQEADAKKAAWVLVDFKSSEIRRKRYLFDPVILIEDMAVDLEKKAGADLHILREKIEKYRKHLFTC